MVRFQTHLEPSQVEALKAKASFDMSVAAHIRLAIDNYLGTPKKTRADAVRDLEREIATNQTTGLGYVAVKPPKKNRILTSAEAAGVKRYIKKGKAALAGVVGFPKTKAKKKKGRKK